MPTNGHGWESKPQVGHGGSMDSDMLFRQADEAYDKGDFAKAFSLFIKASEHGDCHAMT